MRWLPSLRMQLCSLLLVTATYGSANSTAVAPSKTISTTASYVSSLSAAISVSLEASVSSLRSASSLAFPTPANFTTINHDLFTRLLEAMPPVQTMQHNVDAIINHISSDETSYTHSNLTARAGQIKVMIVGDSMTQGADGDWTWRYRMWQWFRSNGISVDFVGPYSGTANPLLPGAPPAAPPLYGAASPSPTLSVNGKYAADVDPAFDSDHFAIWGRAMAVDQSLIQGFVKQYQPDFMLVMLGFNDLGWFYSDEYGLINSLQSFVNNARAAKPNINFAIANVPQRLWLGRQDLVDKTSNYNNMLPQKLTSMSTADSPCVLVQLEETYTCSPQSCPAGYDGLHPDSLGDYEIASAFSATLHNYYKLGNGVLQIPSNPPLRNVPMPTNLKVVTSPQGVTATWDAMPGAYSYDVQISLDGGAWTSASVRTNRWDPQWPFTGSTYAVQVRTNCGHFDYLQSAWTGSQSAKSQPQLAPAPRNIAAVATSTGLTVTWDPPTGPYTDSIVEYNIIYWDLDTDCDFITGAAFKSSPAHIDGLNPNHRYLVAPTTINANGMGWPTLAHNVKVGVLNTPPKISGLNVQLSGLNNVYASWTGSSDAAGYAVSIRNTLNTSDVLTEWQTTQETCFNLYMAYPANSYWEYCFSAFNGNRNSGYSASQCTQPPAASGTPVLPTCPTPPPWCPSFFNPTGAPAGDGDAPPATQSLGAFSKTTATGSSTATPTTILHPGPDDNGNGVDGMDTYATCDYSVHFDTLDALNAAAGQYRSDCLAVYELDTLTTMMQVAYTNYTSVNDGYDAEFGYYIEYIKKLIPVIIDSQFMYGDPSQNGNQGLPPKGPGQQYFTCQSTASGSKPQPCTDLSELAYMTTTAMTVSDQNGYNTAITNLGFDADWVTFGDYSINSQFSTVHGGRAITYKFTGFPIENSSLSIINPKDIVTHGLGDIPSLITQMQATLIDMQIGSWFGGSLQDPAQSYSTAVFILMQAVDGMAQAKALGEEQQQADAEAERKRQENLILTILTIVLLFIPIVGDEVATLTGLSQLGRLATLAGDVGNVAISIYNTVTDPGSALVNTLGLLFGVGSIVKATRDGPGLASVAKARAGLSAADIASFGKIFGNEDAKLQGIAKICKF